MSNEIRSRVPARTPIPNRSDARSPQATSRLTACSPHRRRSRRSSLSQPVEDCSHILTEFEKTTRTRKRHHRSRARSSLCRPTRSFSTSATRPKACCLAQPSTTTPKVSSRATSFPVSVTGRNEEGYYELSRFKVAQPRDWTALEEAFAQKLAVVGTVTGVVKGGLNVDVGVRAFMPASRSGTRDAAELEKLVGTEITCRITKLDVTDEDVVVDRRVVLEEQARAAAGRSLRRNEAGRYARRHRAQPHCPTAHSSISAASTAFSTSATSRGPASTSRRTCSPSARRSRSASSRSIRKRRRFRSA